MPWGSIIGAVGGLLSDGGGGGGQGTSQTVSKDPWSVAAPWLTQNVATGQSLQNYYQRSPFNTQQQKAYGNLNLANDYVNQLVPSLLSQISGVPSFNRANPSARPAPINFSTMLGFGEPTGAGGSAGGAYNVDMNYVNNPFANGGATAAPPPTAPAPVAPVANTLPSWLYDEQHQELYPNSWGERRGG